MAPSNETKWLVMLTISNKKTKKKGQEKNDTYLFSNLFSILVTLKQKFNR